MKTRLIWSKQKTGRKRNCNVDCVAVLRVWSPVRDRHLPIFLLKVVWRFSFCNHGQESLLYSSYIWHIASVVLFCLCHDWFSSSAWVQKCISLIYNLRNFVFNVNLKFDSSHFYCIGRPKGLKILSRHWSRLWFMHTINLSYTNLDSIV